MDKYKPVQEILQKDGIALDELLQLVKSGKLALYAMKRQFEYEVITSFDRYVDDYIARERERLERQYISNITHIQYPSERIARANSICQSIRERYQGQREIRQIGVDDIIRQNHDKAIKELADRDKVEIDRAIRLFVKSSDYENMANSGNSRKQGKREDTEIRKQKTLKACELVEKEYGPLLLNKSRQDVLNLVSAEMNYKQPYTPTFSKWFTDCPHTRGQGNPNLAKKPA